MASPSARDCQPGEQGEGGQWAAGGSKSWCTAQAVGGVGPAANNSRQLLFTEHWPRARDSAKWLNNRGNTLRRVLPPSLRR